MLKEKQKAILIIPSFIGIFLLATSNIHLEAFGYTLEATDTRNPGSKFVVIANSTAELEQEINNLVSSSFPAAPSSNIPFGGVSAPANDTLLQRNVDQIVNSIAGTGNATASPTGGLGVAAIVTILNNLSFVNGELCYNVGWFKICIKQ